MGKILISAGHGGLEDGALDMGVTVPGTSESAEMIRIRDLVVPELRSRGFEVLSVPDDLSREQTLRWINSRCQRDDVALEIHAGAATSPGARGASVFYIANNEVRKSHAELLLLALLRRVPQLPSRGAKPDTTTGVGNLDFTRRLGCPSLFMEVGYLTNPDDLGLIQNRRRDIALGIADGVASWSRAVAGNAAETIRSFPEVNIKVNTGLYDEKGIIINNNAYIPIDLADQLDVNVVQDPEVRRIRYRGVVYIKAIDLREYNVSVGWDATTRSVTLKTINALPICSDQLQRIMGKGVTSDIQMLMFLKANNENAVQPYKDLPRFYREEGETEGVNHDLAFCQMCLETSYLRFLGSLRPESNNFGGIGAVSGDDGAVSFDTQRIGVQAHIQHLKAYGSTEPLAQRVADPRFRLVRRGVAPLITDLSGRWDADPLYGEKIMAILRRLYESAGLL
ncbi:N-acetylmuramoyl-L-alanine amidase [Oscillatoria sp. CS-180]|uniref:hormogonium tapered terminus morphoprotein TftA n=1 Tax=Oscillatoria sp. CS-180 TaxID=3021720 RepID=UPI00232D8E4F|nr:N-acetylmuramoyl-L-alanine amidase [Oscillatoria sp. CS-180]MDB9527487.1 N-acetylmuramoyl-L-alanine amidase [Oscillatoria sp. CS-180]